MASGSIGSEEIREKPRWNENCKVYTRRFRNKNASSNNQSPATATASIAGEASTTTETNNNENATADKDEANNTNNSAQSREAEDPNSNQEQPNSPVIEVISGDTTSLNRQEEAFLNDHDENTANESTLVRPVIERIDDDKVRINLSTALLKHERRELKRKLVSELEEVKELAKKLKYREAQLIRYNDEFTTGTGFPTGIYGQSRSQYKEVQRSRYNDDFTTGNGFSTGINDSVGCYDSMPFQHLSVSVMNNTNHVMKRAPKANQYYRSSEFISGTDKIPSTEIKKKTKTKGRKKQGKASSTFKQILKKCATLLSKLMKNQYGWVFNTPVDVKSLNLHDYYDVIKYPMDLGTIKTRLSRNWYKSPLEFAEDVRLTFHNAMTYNPEGQDVHIMAVELLNVFEESWVHLEADYSTKLGLEPAYDKVLPLPLPLPTYVSPPPLVYQETKQLYLDRSDSVAQKPPVIRTRSLKKPKAGDLNKRDMTSDEKVKLSGVLENLPPEKFDIVVQIIKKRNSAFSENDNVFEVDIESIDAETLWELDRFVINYKKNLSKKKRKAELAHQRAEAQQEIQVTNPVVSIAEVPKETTADDTNAISGSSPVLERTEAAANLPSSSSSSSDSGSSSSDSDSDSSSSSESEGG